MLKPDDRSHLRQLLRPPDGMRLDAAVGTTYSINLESTLTLPLAFTSFDWERPGGEPLADPLALLEALRRYRDRFTLFYQEGAMHLPEEYSRLTTLLEPCLHPVHVEGGNFHPKLWVMRFVGGSKGETVAYRVLCLSRNLTNERNWDTAVVLDGDLTDRTYGFAANHPLGDLLDAMPTWAGKSLSRERRQTIKEMAGEVRRVHFEWPGGFSEYEKDCRFWAMGIEGRDKSPFPERQDKVLIVSPFVSDGVLKQFVEQSGEVHLISRLEALRDLPNETLRGCKSVRYLAPEAVDETDKPGDALEGLHAKLYVIDQGWTTSVFCGSLNATHNGLHRNVEFLVEMVGKRSQFGVDQFLEQVNGETKFADLLQYYDLDAPAAATDAVEKELEQLLFSAKEQLLRAGLRLTVRAADESDGRFEMEMRWERLPRWERGITSVKVWPISFAAQEAHALNGTPIVFGPTPCLRLTPLLAFEISAEIGGQGRREAFVLKVPIEGMPEDRENRVVRSMFDTSEKLTRHLMFLLADEGEGSVALFGEGEGVAPEGEAGPKQRQQHAHLLETMLRALHREPEQVRRVRSLLETLRKTPGETELWTTEFERICAPILAVAEAEAAGK